MQISKIFRANYICKKIAPENFFPAVKKYCHKRENAGKKQHPAQLDAEFLLWFGSGLAESQIFHTKTRQAMSFFTLF